MYAYLYREHPLQADGLGYAQAAKWFADGKGFLNPLNAIFGDPNVPDATHPPMWTIVLAVPAKLGIRSNFSFQVFAALIGSGTVALTGLAAREAFGRRIGLIAAGLVCLYPGIWLYERELFAESLSMFMVALFIWLVYRFRRRPGIVPALTMGLALGVAALTRSELIAMSVLVVTPLYLGTRSVSWGRRVGWLAMTAAVTVAVISPWFLYNRTRFSEPVPLSVGLGATMAAGNCGPTYDGERIGYYHFGCVILAKNISPDASVADGQFRSLALKYITQHKAGFVKVAAIRLGRTFSVYDPIGQREFEAERGSQLWVLTAALLAWWVLVPFAVWGFVVARRRKVPVYPLGMFFVLAVVAVIPTIGAVRYRAPAEIAFVVLAAVGIDAVARALARRREQGDEVGDDETSTPDPPREVATV